MMTKQIRKYRTTRMFSFSHEVILSPCANPRDIEKVIGMRQESVRSFAARRPRRTTDDFQWKATPKSSSILDSNLEQGRLRNDSRALWREWSVSTPRYFFHSHNSVTFPCFGFGTWTRKPSRKIAYRQNFRGFLNCQTIRAWRLRFLRMLLTTGIFPVICIALSVCSALRLKSSGWRTQKICQRYQLTKRFQIETPEWILRWPKSPLKPSFSLLVIAPFD